MLLRRTVPGHFTQAARVLVLNSEAASCSSAGLQNAPGSGSLDPSHEAVSEYCSRLAAVAGRCSQARLV